MLGENDNRGTIFKNDDHAKTPYGGSATVEGIEYWINAWVNKTTDGRSYFRLSFKPKSKPPETRQPLKDELDDNVPF